MADHGHEHRNGDVVELAHADARHDEILEQVHAGAHFSDAIEIFGERRGRRRSDGHDRRRHPGIAQPLRGKHRSGTLTLGHGAYVTHRPAVVRFAGVRHHTTQFHRSGRGKPAPYFEKQR